MKKEEPKFISLAEAAKLTSYSQDYISLLCRQGKLKAEKLGRNWVTTKEWVYSYVDNTAGKGESVVAVKVKEAAVKTAEAETEKVENKEEKNKKGKQPFYGQRVLETAFFCFACVVWAVNIFLFVAYYEKGDFTNVSQTNAGYELKTSATDTASDAVVDNAATAKTDTHADADAGTIVPVENRTIDSLPPFEKETDAAVIAQRTKEIQAKFSDLVDAEIYKNFAIVNYKNSPDKKFLYVMGN